MANEITKVTDQNNVDHPLRDAAAQTALTGILNGQSIDSFGDVESALAGKFPRSEQAVLGAKNWFDYTKINNSADVTITDEGQHINYLTATAGTWFNRQWDIPVKKNTNYILTTNVIRMTGAHGIKVRGSDKQTVLAETTAVTDAEKDYSLSFNTGNNETINIVLFGSDETSAISELSYNNLMVKLATDTDPTFAPYAKTNRELTEDVANIPTVSVTHTGTASSTGVRKQQITVNNVSYDVDGSAYMEQSVTLSTSQSTDVVFTNAIIADGTELTFSSSIWDLVPDDMVTTTGVCTVTLPKWTSAVTIGCRLRVR